MMNLIQTGMRHIIYGIVFTILLCARSLYAETPPMPTGMPQFSPAEQKQLEAEMAAFQEEFSKLTPQEQESFYQSMEEAVQKIEELAQTNEGKELLDKLDKGEISDEELDKLINQLTGEEAKEAEELPIKEPEEVKEEPKAAPKPPVILSSKEEQAIGVISSLILQTDSFLVKVATVPEFPGKIKQWSKKGAISWTSSTENWPSLKQDIEQLVIQLSSLLDQDQKTGEYYHIGELLKNETLYNNIRKVQTVVSNYEPKVEEASPLQKMSKSSKVATQKLINQYIEALYVLKLSDEINALVKKFEPKALGARALEEKATKEAEQAAKQQPTAPGRSIIAGKQAPMYSPLYQYPEPRAPRPVPKTFIPAPPSQAYTPPAVTPTGAPARAAATPAKKPLPSKVKESSAKTPADREDETGIPKEYREQVAAIDKKRQENINRLTNSTSDMITSVAKGLENIPILNALQKHITDETPVNIELVTEIIPDTKRELSIRKGIQGKIGELNRTIRTANARKEAHMKLKKQYDKHKKTLEDLERQITDIEQKFDTLKDSIPAEKLYAYFGIVPAQPEEPTEEKEELPYNQVEETLEKIAKTAPSEEAGIVAAVEYLEETAANAREEFEKTLDLEQEDVVAQAAEPLAEIQRKVPSPISLFELRDLLRGLKKSINELGKWPRDRIKSR